jgi:hypothetical protein
MPNVHRARTSGAGLLAPGGGTMLYCACAVRVPASGVPYVPRTCRAPQALSRLTHLPVITIYLAAGLLSQLFMPGSLHKPLHDLLQPVHDAALGCITLAAGGRSLSKVPSRRSAPGWGEGEGGAACRTCCLSGCMCFGFHRPGGELVLEQLRANARAISCITLWLSFSSLLLVFPATLFVLVRPG